MVTRPPSLTGARPGHHAPSGCVRAMRRAYIIYSIRWIWSGLGGERIFRENVYYFGTQKNDGSQSAVKNSATTPVARTAGVIVFIIFFFVLFGKIVYIFFLITDTTTIVERFEPIPGNYTKIQYARRRRLRLGRLGRLRLCRPPKTCLAPAVDFVRCSVFLLL